MEVCPHGALGETPNFELSFFNRFGADITLEKNDLADAPNYLVRQRLPRGKKDLPVMSPLVRPLPARGIRDYSYVCRKQSAGSPLLEIRFCYPSRLCPRFLDTASLANGLIVENFRPF